VGDSWGTLIPLAEVRRIVEFLLQQSHVTLLQDSLNQIVLCVVRPYACVMQGHFGLYSINGGALMLTNGLKL